MAPVSPLRKGPLAPLGPLARSPILRAPACRWAASRSAHRPNFAATPAAAEEPVGAVGLQPRHAHARRHLEPFQHLTRARIDAPQLALVAFPGAVPEPAIDPGDPGDVAVGLDGAQDR